MALNQVRDTLTTVYDQDKRRLLSALSHGSIFFSTLMFSIGIPIATLFISDDPVVKANAKEAINFSFNVWLWGAILALIVGVWSVLTLGLLTFLLFPLIALGFIWHWGFSVWAIMSTLNNPNEPFRYPFILRLI